MLASEPIYVGEHPENDVRRAKRTELKAAWQRTEGFEPLPEADAVIQDLVELPECTNSLEQG